MARKKMKALRRRHFKGKQFVAILAAPNRKAKAAGTGGFALIAKGGQKEKISDSA